MSTREYRVLGVVGSVVLACAIIALLPDIGGIVMGGGVLIIGIIVTHTLCVIKQREDARKEKVAQGEETFFCSECECLRVRKMLRSKTNPDGSNSYLLACPRCGKTLHTVSLDSDD